MKKKAKKQQQQNSITSALSGIFGGKTIEQVMDDAKPASAREIALELRNILREEQELEESGVNIKAIAKAVAAELKSEQPDD